MATPPPAPCRFRALPAGTSIQLQLCDLEDEEVQAVLRRGIPKAAQCRLRSGWLTQKEHSSLLQHIKERFQVREVSAINPKGFHPKPLIPEPAGAADCDGPQSLWGLLRVCRPGCRGERVV